MSRWASALRESSLFVVMRMRCHGVVPSTPDGTGQHSNRLAATTSRSLRLLISMEIAMNGVAPPVRAIPVLQERGAALRSDVRKKYSTPHERIQHMRTSFSTRSSTRNTSDGVYSRHSAGRVWPGASSPCSSDKCMCLSALDRFRIECPHRGLSPVMDTGRVQRGPRKTVDSLRQNGPNGPFPCETNGTSAMSVCTKSIMSRGKGL